MKNRISKAYEYGKKAFKNGLQCIPGHDKNVLFLIKNLPMGTNASVKIYKAWIKGWTLENINSPVN